MSKNKTPFEQTQDQHGNKETLVDRVLGVVHLGEEERDAVKARLLAVSNRKLLRMLAVGSEIKEKYGSPEGLASAVAEALGKAKDKDYVVKLTQVATRWPARALDMLNSAKRRAKRAA